MRYIISEARLYILNHVVSHVPIYAFRRFCYERAGMEIGKDSRLLMGIYIQEPSKIHIGDHCCINEFCMLDGRGGLYIKDNVSVSMYTKILTGTHDSNSDDFSYKSEPVVLEDNVWTGMGSIILPGTVLPKGSILAAGSVAIKNKKYLPKCVYSGIPAEKIGERQSECNYELNWKPYFR